MIIESITDRELSAIVDDLYLDDAVDFLEELPASVVKRVLRNTNETTRNLINQFLQYPENSAGSLMTIEFVEFHAHNTVREAMDILKRTGVDKETIDTCYAVSYTHLGRALPPPARLRPGPGSIGPFFSDPRRS